MISCCGADALLASTAESGRVADLVYADPPWTYTQQGGPDWSCRGAAQDQYAGLTVDEIAEHLSAAHAIASDDCYLIVWCTWPKLAEWMSASAPMPWTYITGGAWGKTSGLGVGFHFRGDSEPLLLYRKGRPRPLTARSNLWLSARTQHSEKPRAALEPLISSLCPPGGLVLDPYAGQSASCAIVCRRLGREYMGSEIDPARHAAAMLRLSQLELFQGSAVLG